jgi:hypothetical protein
VTEHSSLLRPSVRALIRPELAVVVLLGLTGCQSTGRAKPRHTALPGKVTATVATTGTVETKAPGSPQCAFYGVTLAVGLLSQYHGPLPTVTKLRKAWPRVVTESRNANRLFEHPSARLRPVAASYKALLATIDEASAALDRGDTTEFRSVIDHARSTLASAEREAKHARLTCQIKSKDGSTLTFGG